MEWKGKATKGNGTERKGKATEGGDGKGRQGKARQGRERKKERKKVVSDSFRREGFLAEGWPSPLHQPPASACIHIAHVSLLTSPLKSARGSQAAGLPSRPSWEPSRPTRRTKGPGMSLQQQDSGASGRSAAQFGTCFSEAAEGK